MSSHPFDLRLGVDVGGTNTDTVVVDRDGRLLGKAKSPTTADVSSGIEASIRSVLALETIDVERITHVMLGTTHATNAVLERRGLQKVAVIRIGGPATHAIRPLFGWPGDLRAAVSVDETIVDGGIELDGREIVPLDRDAVRGFLESLCEPVDAVAITSVFAPVSSRHELAAEEVTRSVLGDVHVSLSHQVGSIGLLERENATVLNAALIAVAGDVSRALEQALSAHGLSPVTFFAQNDGTLMALDYAHRMPVLTIGSGPANSLRGAAHLMGADDGLVADIGGTSTDIGVLVKGFPRESSAGVEVGGVRTTFRMPDLVSIALGGGTVVRPGDNGDGVQVGPASTGQRLTQEGLVFGGSTPTMTDAAVLTGRATLGDPAGAKDHEALLAEAVKRADAMLADAVDRIKTSRSEQPLVLVGGGSVIAPQSLAGVSEIHRPEHFEVASAIGAAIALVSGQVDRIVPLDGGRREQLVGELCEEAKDRAVQAGADPEAVQIVEVDEVPLTYLTGSPTRVRARAAGPMGAV
jgi:N-methylhydantoinase A/oxoprolinase/acetone carboxylase beta subunit